MAVELIPITLKPKLESPKPLGEFSIAFCFLLYAEPAQNEVWKRYFQRADELGLKYTIHVHNTEPLTDPYWAQYETPTKSPSNWAHTVNAQLNVWREAAKTNPDYILLHSGNCIPTQTPDKLWAFLQKQTKSIAPYLLQFKNEYGTVRRNQVKALCNPPHSHSQFVAIHKDDYQTVFNYQKYPQITKLFADNEHVLACVLPISRLLNYPLSYRQFKSTTTDAKPINYVKAKFPPTPPENAKKNTYLQVFTPELFNLIAKDSYFMRKVGSDLDSEMLCNLIGI